MDTRTLYKRVTAEVAMPQNEFFDYYNDSVRTLCARYGQRFVAEEGNALRPVDSLDGRSGVREIYFVPIVDSIIAMKTGDGGRRADSMSGAEFCYRSVWRTMVSGKKIRGERW